MRDTIVNGTIVSCFYFIKILRNRALVMNMCENKQIIGVN